MIKSVLAGRAGARGLEPLFKPAFSPRRGTREPRSNRYLVAPLAPTIGFLALLPSSYRFFLSARIFLQAPLRGEISRRLLYRPRRGRRVSKYRPRKEGSLRRASNPAGALPVHRNRLFEIAEKSG